MEKNYWLALVLSMMVLMGYPFLMKKLQPPQTPQETAAAVQPPAVSETQKPAAIKAAAQESLPEVKAETISFSNPQYDAVFSTRGGVLESIIYKGEQSKVHAQIPLMLSAPGRGAFSTRISNQEVNLSQTIFKLGAQTPGAAEFIYEKPNDFRLTKKYSFDPNLPVIRLTLRAENLSASEKHIPFEIDYGLYYADSHVNHHVDVEAVVYQEKVKGKKLDHVRKKGFLVSETMEWTGLLKKYFAVLAKPDWKILSQENRADEETIYTLLRMEPVTIAAGAAAEKNIFIFAGPQRYETLKNLKMDFELILSKGFFGLFKIWLLVSLKFFNQFAHNFGWAIILLTIALKLLFTPLTHMSYESMRKMKAVQPKMKAIQERYKNDPSKMNREVMELYRRNKVNPMGGCLPMVAQIPIFIAFYQVLNETIELKGAPFMFWIQDLAEPDKLFLLPFNIPLVNIHSLNILPFLMTLSMVWQQKLTPQATTSPEQAQIMKWMPLMMGVLLYNMPSGLALYWFVNNMLTVGHQLIMKRMGDVILHHEDRD